MQTAKLVYIGIFVLIFLPLIYMLIKEIIHLAGSRKLEDAEIRKMHISSAVKKIALWVVCLVLLCVLVPNMYTYTMQTQPLLVAEAHAREVLADLDTEPWAGCQLQMPSQSVEDGIYRDYNVMLENEESGKLVVQVVLYVGEDGEMPVFIDSSVITGEEADELIGRAIYFDVGVYR